MGYAGCVIDVYKARVGASAVAAYAMLRCLLGGAFPLITVQVYDKLGIGWATSTYAFISLALSTVSWLLRRFGPALRERSKYGVGGTRYG